MCSVGTAQNISLDEIQVSPNIDSLKKIIKYQHGAAQLKTLLSLERSSYYWLKNDKSNLASIIKNIRRDCPQEVVQFYLLNSQHERKRLNNSGAFKYASYALDGYAKRHDTTGIIHSLFLMGVSSNTSEGKKGIYYNHPYFLNAFNLSLKTKNKECILMGKYALIRQYGFDSLSQHHKEIVKLASDALEIIEKNPYFSFLKPSFLSALVLTYGAINNYGQSCKYDSMTVFLFKKKKLPVPNNHLGNLAYDYLKLKKYELACQYYETILKSPDFKKEQYTLILYTFNSYHAALCGLNRYKEASIYADSIFIYSQKYRAAENTKNIDEIATKYDVNKKEKENIILQQEKQLVEFQNTIYIIAALLTLVMLPFICFISYKLKQSNVRLLAANQNIQQLNRIKEHFYSIIAHDIRQPLISFQGISDTIKYYLEVQKFDKIEKIAEEIDNTGEKLQLMLDSLLKWTLAQREEIPYKPQKVNIYTQIQEVLNLYKSLINSKRIYTNIVCERNKSIFVDNDGFSLILRNIIGNAIKSMDRDGALTIEVSPLSSTIKIQDNGCGIEEGMLEIINEILANPEKAQPGINNIGLGLSLVSRFTQRNGGTIQVESIFGIGTIFTLKF